MKKFASFLIAAVMAAFILGPGVEAQDWPNRPIRLVVGYPPGGATDTVARLLAAGLAERLGQQVIVENKPGAGSMIASQSVARAPPDGYTFLVASNPFTTNVFVFDKPLYDPVADFEPVQLTIRSTYVMVAHPSLGVATLPELIAKAKLEAGKLDYASPGAASPQQLAMERLKRATGMAAQAVPYNGSGPMLADLLAGRVPITIDSVANMVPHIQRGALKALAVSTRKRSDRLPETPTMIEAGVADFEATSWIGVFAPARTPTAIVERVSREIAAVARQGKERDRMVELGMDPQDGGPEVLKEAVRRDLQVFGPIIKELGIREQLN
jgi:tripartite-type tricarboxylate transporter receptor subunit TctC